MQKRHRFDSEPLCKTALGAAPLEIKTAALKISVPTRQVNYRAHSPAPIPQLVASACLPAAGAVPADPEPDLKLEDVSRDVLRLCLTPGTDMSFVQITITESPHFYEAMGASGDYKAR